jgi:hypothetical protein
MITLLGSPRVCCDGMTRRETLQAGGLSLLGSIFGAPALLNAEQAAKSATRPGKAKSVILLYLMGGAATQDMFDMKPDAPAEVRGEFRPIASNVPGIHVCEHLPRTTKWMHKAALIRSVNHRAGCHNPLPSYTGCEQPLLDPTATTTSDTYPPSMGSVCEYLRQGRGNVPAYMFLPNYMGWGQSIRRPGPYAGFLGKRYDPVCSECDPSYDRKEVNQQPWQEHPPIFLGQPYLPDSALGAGITLDRLDARQGLVKQFDRQVRRLENEPALSDFDRSRQRAIGLLTSSKLRAAFNLDATPAALRDRYGRTLFGSSALCARRLVEAGVRFVNVTWDSYREKFRLVSDFAWDTHYNNFVFLRKANLPNLDITYTALMEDLDSRGLLDETLVVVMSDFGRTPRVNKNAGRDHWTQCYTVMLAGAGIRGGTVYGASDAQAAFVKDRPVSTGDICATIFQCLGIDPDMLVYDRSNRPVPIANGGKPIREVLA